MKFSLRLLGVVLALGFASGSTAQTSGEIRGTAYGPDGVVLPGVSVRAVSPALPGERTAITDAGGGYRIPEVPPGSYTVTFRREGNGPVSRQATVGLDGAARVDAVLGLSRKESVEVSGEAPPIEPGSAAVESRFPRGAIENLPLNRNYTDVVRAVPGVAVDRGDQQGRSAALAIHGATSTENLFLIDGIDTTNLMRGFQGKAINDEFIDEVDVKTEGFSAEYGHSLGGVVNVITRSGGNEFHGGAFVRYSSDALRSSEVFNSNDSPDRPQTPGFDKTDWGADVGGYILRDRLWFFGAYNRVRSTTDLSPSAGPAAGTVFPQYQTDNLWSAKLTANVSSATTIVATAFADPSVVDGAVLTSTELLGRRDIGGRDVGLRVTQLFGATSVATLQLDEHNDRYQLKDSGDDRIQFHDDSVVPGITTGGLGEIRGYADNNTGRRREIRGDDEVFLKNHDLKAGVGYAHREVESVDRFTGGQTVTKFIDQPTGTVYYEHVFLSSAFSPNPVPINGSLAKPVTRDWSAYVQDSARLFPSLTVNAGLRWDRHDIQDYQGITRIKLDKEWQPRIGVAWDAWKDGGGKVTASIGRYFFALPLVLSVREYGGLITSNTWNFDPVSTDQAEGVPGFPHAVQQGGAYAEPADKNLQGTYQDELTLGAERMVAPGLVVSLNGIYRRLGNAIEDRCDLDPSAPENLQNSCANINPGSSEKWASGDFPWCDGYNEGGCHPAPAPASPSARRLYRAIELVARKTIAQRAWLQASYIYSSLRGNYDGGVYEEIGQSNPGLNIDYDYPAQFPHSYGNLYLDRPHQFRLDGYALTPFGLDVGLQFWIRSGVPIDKLDSAWKQNYGDTRFLIDRGTAGRNPTEIDANLVLGYSFVYRSAAVTPQLYFYNLLNRQTVTYVQGCYICGPPGSPNHINPNYRKAESRSPPRQIVLAIKIGV